MKEEEVIRVATFNIHKLEDSESIKDILDANCIDICGLQEVPGIKRLQNVMGNDWECLFDYGYPKYGTGLIYRRGKFSHEKIMTHTLKGTPGKKTAFEVWLSKTNKPKEIIRIIVTHLDHKTENQRMKELEVLQKIMPSEPHILLGDLNSLTRSDYTNTEWQRISEVRAKNDWEGPKTNVTSTLSQLGYIDVLSLSKTVVPTCRFDTRVDYIYVWGSIPYHRSFVLDSKGVSDHKIVVVDI